MKQLVTSDNSKHASNNARINNDNAIIDINVYAKTGYKSPAFHLYMLLASLTGNNSNKANIQIEDLAACFNRTPNTTRRWLKFLAEKGIIEQITSNLFIVHDEYRDNLEQKKIAAGCPTAKSLVY